MELGSRPFLGGGVLTKIFLKDPKRHDHLHDHLSVLYNKDLDICCLACCMRVQDEDIYFEVLAAKNIVCSCSIMDDIALFKCMICAWCSCMNVRVNYCHVL